MEYSVSIMPTAQAYDMSQNNKPRSKMLDIEEQTGALDIYPPTKLGSIRANLDNFGYNDPLTFDLRYLQYSGFCKDYERSNTCPVFLYAGNEGAIESFYNNSGGVFELAEQFQATVIFIEHRYYGESLPFGPEDSFDKEKLRFLTVEQALADYTNFIANLPTLVGCSSSSSSSPTATTRKTPLCDTVLFGGSYGGMLAAWHRFKYPHITLGAIASGAPIDFYPHSGIQTFFDNAWQNTFEMASPGCGAALKYAIMKLEDPASTTYETLEAAGMKSCENSVGIEEDYLKKFIFYAKGAISSLAMIDYPYPCSFIAPLPANPVKLACDNILKGGDLSEAEKVVGIVDLYVNASGDLKCYDLGGELVGDEAPRRPSSSLSDSGTSLGVTSWNYQACTQLILEPITSDGFGFFPPTDGEETSEVVKNCHKRFGVFPRPTDIMLSFGIGEDITKSYTNVLFAENQKDPWHVGSSMFEANEDRGIYKIMGDGAHHQDLRFASELDGEGVLKVRELERKVIRKWLGEAR